jgi:RNA polymerase sigma-70 factor (ECF subfamily)
MKGPGDRGAAVLGAAFAHTLENARAGSDAAWTAIYRELAPSVLGYLRVRGATDPEDLTGEVFLQVVRDLCSFRGDEREFRAWVLVIAHHRLLDQRRRNARRPVEAACDVPEGESRDAEEAALEAMGTDRVRMLLQHLSRDQREVLLLRVIGQLTVAEVARATGRQIGAVKALQRRGLHTLKRVLDHEAVPL